MASNTVKFTVSAKDNASKVLDKVNKNLKKSSGVFKKSFGDMAASAKKAGIAMIAFGVGLTGIALKKAAKFEQQMANIATLISTDVVDSIQYFQEELFKIESPTSVNELADGLYLIKSAGYEGARAIEFLTKANRLAVAGNTDTATSTKALIGFMRSYGDESIKSAEAANLLFTINEKGVTTFEEIANVMPLIASAGSVLGVTQKELAATMATLVGSTGNANEVSTQMKAIFTALEKPGDKMQEILGKMGFQSGFAAVEALGLEGTLQGLRKEVGGTDEGMSTLFNNVRAITGVIPLAGRLSENFSDNLRNVEDSTGAVNRAFEKQIDTLTGQWQLAWKEVDKVMIQEGGTINVMLKDMIKSFNSLNEENKNTIISLGAMATAFAAIAGPILLFIGFIPSILNGLKSIWGLLKLVIIPFKILIGFIPKLVGLLKVAVAAITPFVAGISLIAGGLVTAGFLIKKLIDDFGEFKVALGAVSSDIFDWAAGLITKASTWGYNFITELIGGFSLSEGLLETALGGIAGMIKSYLGFSSPTEKGPGSEADKWAPNFIKMFADGIKNGASDMSQASEHTSSILMDKFSLGIKTKTTVVAGAVREVVNTVKTGFSKLKENTTFDEIKTSMTRFGLDIAKLPGKVKPNLAQITDSFKGLKKDIMEQSKQMSVEFHDNLKSIRKDAEDLAKSMKDLQTSFDTDIGGEKKGLAEEYVAQQEKIKSMEGELSDKRNAWKLEDELLEKNRLQNEMNELSAKLELEREALASAAEFETTLSNEIKEAKRRNTNSAFTNFIEDYKKRLKVKTDDFNEDMQILKDKKTALTLHEKEVIKLHFETKKEVSKMVRDATRIYSNNLTAQANKTKTHKDLMVSYFGQISTAISTMIRKAKEAQQMGLSIGGFAKAHGGRVRSNPLGQVSKYAHGGEIKGAGGLDNVPVWASSGEIILNAAQQRNLAGNIDKGGTSVNVTITGNSFYGDDENFAEKIGNTIMQNFKQHMSIESF